MAVVPEQDPGWQYLRQTAEQALAVRSVSPVLIRLRV